MYQNLYLCSIHNDLFWLQYLTIGMISEGFVSFVHHDTLNLRGRTGASGQVIGQNLWGQEKNPLLLPGLLSFLGRHGPFEIDKLLWITYGRHIRIKYGRHIISYRHLSRSNRQMMYKSNN